jgi:hypothetical protein
MHYGTKQTMHNGRYKTNELELASFLKAQGHKLLGVEPKGRLVEFHFDALAEKAVEEYFAGASLAARDLFEAHRSLRALIQQVKSHNNQIGDEFNNGCNRN